MAQKEVSRKEKTQAYFKHRDAFLALLVFEIAAHVRKAERKGMDAGVRLNATSDLPWEVRKVTIDGETVGLMDAFPSVSFYDYTKVTKRALAHARGEMPSNYYLTFSKTEDNDADVGRVLNLGGNVAVVMSPDNYKLAVKGAIHLGRDLGTFRSIDGDLHDYRPADPRGVVVALRAKGDARKDTSGFVLA
ncbi:hypothetical protein XMM379_003135 [Aliiroseovarius sp. xm-m-379]|nr:hypothetical protein [Aliiroseovarius sp. xm-m-379]